MGCLVSIFAIEINSKLFTWPVHSVQETYSRSVVQHQTRLHGMSHHADGLSGRGLMTLLEQGKDRSFNKIKGNWVMNCTGIVSNGYVRNAAMTLVTVLATIPLLFSDGTRHLFPCCRYRCRDVQII